MTLLQQARPASAPVDVPPRRRRRTPWAVGTLAAAALLWGGLGILDPMAGDLRPAIDRDAGLSVAAYNGGDGETFLHYRHGEQVDVRVNLRNRSPLPIRIDDISTPSEPRPLLTPVGIAGAPDTLAPFAEAEVTLRFEFGNCRYWHERGAQTVDSVSLDGSVIGRDWHQDVALAQPVAVHSQVIGNCPDRTLVRGDDTR